MSTLYATFQDPDSAQQAARELLGAGAVSADLRLVCWPTGGMVSLLTPSGGLERNRLEQILKRHGPLSLGDHFEAGQSQAGLSLYEDDFQADARRRFQGPRWEQFRYQDFQPAYYFGSELAHDMHLRDCDWNEVEGEARQAWPAHFSMSWEEMRGAIQYAYERVSSGLVGPL